jgi:hypothetical protein
VIQELDHLFPVAAIRSRDRTIFYVGTRLAPNLLEVEVECRPSFSSFHGELLGSAIARNGFLCTLTSSVPLFAMPVPSTQGPVPTCTAEPGDSSSESPARQLPRDS